MCKPGESRVNAGKRVHFVVVHIDIVNGKVWIEKRITPKTASPRSWSTPEFRSRKSFSLSVRQR